MKLSRAIEILESHNKWRRHDDDIPQTFEELGYTAKDIGIAIDKLVNHSKRNIINELCDIVYDLGMYYDKILEKESEDKDFNGCLKSTKIKLGDKFYALTIIKESDNYYITLTAYEPEKYIMEISSSENKHYNGFDYQKDVSYDYIDNFINNIKQHLKDLENGVQK